MNDQNPPKKYQILIVDDIKDNLLALKALLAREDVTVLQAQSGTEALELMFKHEFSVALLDVQMPGMNGFELAELMRGANRTKNIPIIFVTAADNDEKFLFKGYESGAVDFLRKPLNSHMVRSKVNVFLQLDQQKQELEFQVKELKKVKLELEQAVNVREEFMSIAGHELKTPLTTLKLQTQMRIRHLDKGQFSIFEEATLFKMFQADNKQLERLTRLIDDMLDISRISSGKLSINLESFDLSHLVVDLIERNSELLNKSGCQVIINENDPIIGVWDRFRIEQVITNLLTNAIRYGAGKPINVSLSRKDDIATVIIKDQGIGIAENDLKRIFQRFERATETEVTGLGLGLYIVSQIIEAHKGEIHVESRPGEGAAFRIHLPIVSSLSP